MECSDKVEERNSGAVLTIKKSSLYTHLALGGLFAFTLGMATYQIINDTVVKPFVHKAGQASYDTYLVIDTIEKINGGDKDRINTIQSLAEHNSLLAASYLVSDKRNDAYEKAKVTQENYKEILATVDTRAGDEALLESRKYLSNYNLFWLLRSHQVFFEPKAWLDNQDKIKNGTDREKYLYSLWSKTSLSEQEKAELYACYQKLTKLEKLGEDDFGACSDDFVVPRKEGIPSTADIVKYKLLSPDPRI